MDDGAPPSRLAGRIHAAALAIPFALSVLVQLVGRAPSPMAAPPRRPALAFDQYVIDLGPVAASEEVRVEFHFTNRGPEEVKINELTPSCGCLQPQLKKWVYAPGESGRFMLRVQTANQLAGQKEYQVGIKYNDPEPRETSVVFRVQLSENQVFVRPPVLALSIPSGSPPTVHEVKITDRRPRHLNIVRADCLRNLAAVELLEETEGEAGEWTARLKVTVPGNLPPDRYPTMVRIFTDDPAYRMLRVPLTIEVRPSATIVDPQVRTASGTKATDG